MRRVSSAVAAALVGVLALTACGGNSEADAKPKAKPSHKAKAKGSGALAPAVPKPDAQQTAALVKALKAVDAGLVEDQQRAVSRARNVCLDIKQDKKETEIRANARTRFMGGAVPNLDDAQAGKIVEAVRQTFCE